MTEKSNARKIADKVIALIEQEKESSEDIHMALTMVSEMTAHGYFGKPMYQIVYG